MGIVHWANNSFFLTHSVISAYWPEVSTATVFSVHNKLVNSSIYYLQQQKFNPIFLPLKNFSNPLKHKSKNKNPRQINQK